MHDEPEELRRLRTLDALTDVVLGTTASSSLLRGATRCLVPAFGDWCTVHYVPGGGDPRQVAVASGDPTMGRWVAQVEACLARRPAGEPAVSSVMRAARTQLVDPIDPPTMASVLRRWVVDADGVLEAIGHLGAASVLSVPLRSRGEARGALWMVNADPSRHFDPDDVAALEVAARRISEGLDRVLNAEQHRQISATLQRALLPPRVPRVPGVEVAVRYWPAGRAVQAGGDFYDLFPIGDQRWALLIGDVCGTGPDAAALTSIARHTVRAAARHGQDHLAVLDWLNQAIRMSDRDRFCTATYATLEQADGRWRLATAPAGHPLPILVRPDGTVRVLGRPGSLVGVFDSVTAHVESTDLAPGDTVLLYTDGVTDLPPPADRTVDDMLELLARPEGWQSADELADTVGRWTADRVPEDGAADDVALVVLRVS